MPLPRAVQASATGSPIRGTSAPDQTPMIGLPASRRRRHSTQCMEARRPLRASYAVRIEQRNIACHWLSTQGSAGSVASTFLGGTMRQEEIRGASGGSGSGKSTRTRDGMRYPADVIVDRCCLRSNALVIERPNRLMGLAVPQHDHLKPFASPADSANDRWRRAGRTVGPPSRLTDAYAGPALGGRAGYTVYLLRGS